MFMFFNSRWEDRTRFRNLICFLLQVKGNYCAGSVIKRCVVYKTAWRTRPKLGNQEYSMAEKNPDIIFMRALNS
jgi:hypothetical protein